MSEDYGGSERGYGDERRVEAPKLEGTGPGADAVHAICPESSRGKKLIGFGKLFGLQDIYEWDEECVRGGGAEQAGSSSSTNEKERKWQDHVDGLSAKRKKWTKKAVHFGEASGVLEAGDEMDKPGEKAVATLSLSVQLPTGDGTMGEK